MLLTFSTLPFFVGIASLLTFLLFKNFDSLKLEDYKEGVYGIPPVAVCLASIFPVVVLICYDIVLRMGPKPSKVGIR